MEASQKRSWCRAGGEEGEEKNSSLNDATDHLLSLSLKFPLSFKSFSTVK